MTTKPKSKPKPIDLTAMSQAEMASLVGKPTSWLRDRADLPGRNADGTYDAATFIRGIRSEFVAIELPDGDLEPSLQLADVIAYESDRLTAVVRLLDRIESTHGAPGMAAVAMAIRDACRTWLADMGEYAFKPLQSLEEIRLEADDWAAKKLKEQSEREARHHGRIVLVCDTCGKYRWGRSWREPPTPPTYVQSLHRCPECDK